MKSLKASDVHLMLAVTTSTGLFHRYMGRTPSDVQKASVPPAFHVSDDRTNVSVFTFGLSDVPRIRRLQMRCDELSSTSRRSAFGLGILGNVPLQTFPRCPRRNFHSLRLCKHSRCLSLVSDISSPPSDFAFGQRNRSQISVVELRSQEAMRLLRPFDA